MKEEILENLRIEKITAHFLKAPHKVNGIHEADSELIDLGPGHDRYLAVTTDALAEEVRSGLYADPHLIGWMLAMANFSDLAAVGAEPLGLLVALSYPSTQDEAFLAALAGGISDACRKLNTFVLGGDTNEQKELHLSGCAVGLVPKRSCMTRVGAKEGDTLYLSGPAGAGSAFAFLRLLKRDVTSPEFYRPIARIAEGKVVREFASCCMDTSDGVIHTLDTLMRLNHRQFVLSGQWETILHPAALEVCRAQHLPSWLALASVHGEFELCFSVSREREGAFLQEAAKAGFGPVRIGEVAAGEGVGIKTPEGLIPIASGAIRNLSETAGSDPAGYLKGLLQLALQGRGQGRIG